MEENSKCQSILHDIIKGIRTVKSFGKEEEEIRKFANVTRELAQFHLTMKLFGPTYFHRLHFLQA